MGALLLLAVSFAIPMLARHVPLLENEGVYFSVDQELAHGARVFNTDIWDHKPPLLFMQAGFARALRISNPENARLYLGLIHFVISILVGAVAVRLWGTPSIFWPASFGYVALALPPVFLTWCFEADLLMLPWLLLAVLCATYDGFWAWFLAGTAWACAFFTKQSAIFFLPLFLALKPRDWLGAFKAILIGVDLLALAVLAPFWAGGRMPDFWEAVSGYSGPYVQMGWRGLVASFVQGTGGRLLLELVPSGSGLLWPVVAVFPLVPERKVAPG